MIKLPLTLLAGVFMYITSYMMTDHAEGKAEVNWVTIEEAQSLTKDTPRKVFIDIYADWCGWCKVMDRKTFSNEKVASYINENYYAVRLDAESHETITFKGKELTQRELVRSFKVQGLPTIVFIDEKFNKVKPVPGYQDPEQFLKSLEKFNRR